MSDTVPDNANAECVGPQSDSAGKASSCAGCPNQAACASGANKKQVDPVKEATLQARLGEIKHKLLILSGKGGVGKSTISSQLSWALANNGFQVGILDVDICGPSVPRMMGVEDQEIRRSNFGWSPVYATDNLGVMSVGFMLETKTDAVIWRGPRKNGLIEQFFTDVNWGGLDFLVVDAPPGTSDEHLAVAQYVKESKNADERKVDGAVIVTTPQEVALLDVRKEISFCRKLKIPILGVVENMAGFVCPCCSTKSEIFPAVTGGARAMCQEMDVPFLGSIPLEPQMLQSCEKGRSYLAAHPNGSAVKPFKQFIKNLMEATEELHETWAKAELYNSDSSDDEEGVMTGVSMAGTDASVAAADGDGKGNDEENNYADSTDAMETTSPILSEIDHDFDSMLPPDDDDDGDVQEVRAVIDTSQVGSIIGVGGSHVRSVRESSGAYISILKAEYKHVQERILVMKGTCLQIARATYLVAQLLIKQNRKRDRSSRDQPKSDSTCLRFLAQRGAVGAIIGKGGSSIQETQQKTGSRMQVSNEPLPQSTEKVVSITGSPAAVARATFTVLNQLKESPIRPSTKNYPYVPGQPIFAASFGLFNGTTRGLGTINPTSSISGVPSIQPSSMSNSHSSQNATGASTQKIAIPSVCAGCVIGKGGSVIRDVRAQSGTSISIADPDPDSAEERVVTLTGTPAGIQTAVFLIRQLVEQYQPQA